MARPKRPWFRFYVEAVRDPKMNRLTPAQKWLWVAMLAAARESSASGRLMLSERLALTPDDLAHLSGLKTKEVEQGLVLMEELGMIEHDEEVDAWKIAKWEERQFESDDVAARTAKHRSKVADRNVPTTLPGTPPETETDTETETTLAAIAAEERKDLSGAIFDAIGLDPAILLTGSEQSQLNIAAAELHKVGATLADVRERALVYRARWPDMALTPMALVKHWSALGVMAEDTLGAKLETEADHRDSLKRWAAQWDYLPDEEFFETARNLFPDPSDLEVVASYRSVEA